MIYDAIISSSTDDLIRSCLHDYIHLLLVKSIVDPLYFIPDLFREVLKGEQGD